ncbi:methyl-accepting chemotaxis protein [Bowmanella dokdonensis]|uniref:Methyl-accepting chemotaxis protein n=1 Tax=Bowmanella dokdonensis TaxID=751969 RepID=A0A939IS25_9ALTE|nr:methyl-accepting chemotaxis protein [Bowmanella dokdonensis]MBN7826262.1 methyl-accepting chemotaxis protein [Bowmanella dokdonensis]
MLNQYSVKIRLTVLVVLPILFYILSATSYLTTLGDMNQGIGSLYDDRVVPLKQIKVVSDNYAVEIVDILHKYRAGLITEGELRQRMDAAEKKADEEWKTYKATKLTDREVELAKQAETNLVPVKQKIEQYRGLLSAGTLKSQPAETFVRELYLAFDPLSASYQELIELQLDEADKFRQQADASYTSTLSWMIVKMVALLLIMLGVAWFIYRSIQNPLTDLKNTITRIAADANLTLRVRAVGRDEFAETAGGFNQMLERIHALVKDVAQASTTLSAAAEEMHSISTQVASTATEQEHQTTQIATAVTEMTAAIQEVAQNALNTSQKANNADQQAQLGQSKVQENIQSIDELSKVVNDSSGVIQQLHSQANEINQVVQLIQSVAEQTNLLALNAAIEAARAGDSGRGFAVVADEVRQLAHNTQKATESISDMISKLQVAAKQAVDSMGKAQERAGDSVGHAQESSRVLQDILDAVTEIADMNVQVSTATEEQTTVANEISANVNEFSLSIASVTESSQQNAEASSELAKLAEQLHQQVRAFQV